MKTIVYQSFRPSDVPSWMGRCMRSVRTWAAAQTFDYRFFDDRMFGYAPDWYREKASGNVLLVSDLARLLIAKELLSQGYERTIWIDADVLVFDPDRFSIPVTDEYAFCREVWVKPRNGKRIVRGDRINNAVTVFVRGNSMLDFYIEACLSRVRSLSNPRPAAVSTHFLTQLAKLIPLRQLTQVGLFSPLVMSDIAGGTHAARSMYMRKFGFPVYAANLCSSFHGRMHDGILMDDDLYERAVDRLISTRGHVVNRHLPGQRRDG